MLDNPAFPYQLDIGYGDLEYISEEYKDAPEVPAYALITNEPELDGIYKNMLDDAGVRFYTMDCVLQYPKPEEGEWRRDRVKVIDFLCSDIYEEGMAGRVRAANDAASDYYDNMDAIKNKKPESSHLDQNRKDICPFGFLYLNLRP